MSYESLSPRQKQAVDILMSGDCAPRNTIATLADRMGISGTTVKQTLHEAAYKYGVPPNGPYIPSVRLVYLRAKELGML